MDEELFRDIYLTFVRPHLEYCVQVWSPYLHCEVDKIEKVQRRATKLVPSLHELPYEECLKKLNLTTLEERRHRGDQIETFKIIKGFEKVDRNKFFQERVYGGDLRGHGCMLQKKQVNKEKRRHFFCNRVIDRWNSLPESAVEAETVNQFKNRLDMI